MAEQFPSQAPVYGIDPTTMGVVPMAEHVNSDPADYVTYTRQTIDGLRQHQEQASQGTYTEVHQIEGRAVVAVPPRETVPYGATVGSNHSIVDEITTGGEDEPYPEFKAMAGSFGKDHYWSDSVAAKGYTKIMPDGTAQLKLQEIRRKDGTWLGDLRDTAAQLGFDGGVVIDNRFRFAEAGSPTKLEDVKNKYNVGDRDFKFVEFEESVLTNKNITTGVATNIEVSDPKFRVDITDGNTVHESTRVAIDLAQGHSVQHQPLYEATGFSADNRGGLIDMQVGGVPVKMGIRYSSDHQGQSINIFYDKDYGQTVSDFQASVVKLFERYILPSIADTPNIPLRLTISKGNQPAEGFMLREGPEEAHDKAATVARRVGGIIPDLRESKIALASVEERNAMLEATLNGDTNRPLPAVTLQKIETPTHVISFDDTPVVESVPTIKNARFDVMNAENERVGYVVLSSPDEAGVQSIGDISLDPGKGYGPATYLSVLKSIPEHGGLKTKGQLSPEAELVWQNLAAKGIAKQTQVTPYNTYETV